ncbi:MAG: cytochrome C oxidase subunit IV family protein [Chromatiales bacterium]|nr:cytochrome C oxidase subunit IV family protein [Chromatiales bacterium]
MSNKIMGMRPCTLVYLALIIFTFITFYVGEQHLSGLSISLIVLLLALIKGQLVGSYFMGLGRLQGLWRWPVFIWLFIPGTLISIAFYLSA